MDPFVKLLTCEHGHVLGLVRRTAGMTRLFLFRQAQPANDPHLTDQTPETAAIIAERAVVSCSLCLEPVVWRAGQPARVLPRRSGDFFPFHGLEFKVAGRE